MKRSLVILDRDLQLNGMKPGTDYEFVGNIHDEAQAEVLFERVERYKEFAEDCLPKAGLSFRLKCPLKAEASSGSSWAHTH